MAIDLWVFMAFTFFIPKLWPTSVVTVVQAPMLAFPFEVFTHIAFWLFVSLQLIYAAM